ncbi:hypothetical protein ASD15_30860 [Massilia sp. Root351]|nr:hypothetical protein ASD15_30860 [Massilia sp. Root351]
MFVVATKAGALANWELNTEVRFWRDDSGAWLAQNDGAVMVELRSPGLAARLERRELPWLLRSVRGENVYLQCAEPMDSIYLDAPLELCIDEHIAGQLARDGVIARGDLALALAWCRSALLVEGSPQRLAAVRFDSGEPGEWQVVGNLWRADLQRSAEGRVLVRRLIRSPHRPEAWTLVEGAIGFADVSVTSQLMSEGQQALLRQALQTHGDYIDLWKKYSDVEWQRSLRQAGALGVLAYRSCEEASDEGGLVRFMVDADDLADFRKAWLALESDGALALEAHAHRPDWHSARYQDLSGTESRRRFRGRPRFERGSVLIESTYLPPPEGFLYLSLTGDKTVQERRQKALQNINTQARSLRLRYILQGVGVPVSRITRHAPLSASARACFKHGAATPNQEAAIRAALETPDVALIIGPPGTGKTQVIAALSRRLAEIGGEGGAQHQVLITSFQHDAVENALDRTRVFNLPAVKIGSSRKNEGADAVRQWCLQQHHELERALVLREADEPHAALLNTVHLKLATLRHGQLDVAERAALMRAVADTLEQLQTTHGIRLPRRLQDEMRAYLAQIPNGASVRPSGGARLRVQALKRVRALRHTLIGFADDGAARAAQAHAALLACGVAVDIGDLYLLGQLQEKTALDEAEAEGVVALRERLIDLLRADDRPALLRHRLDVAGQHLIGAIEEALADRLKTSRLGVSGVLARYRDAFVNHPSRTRETVRTYAMVVGATCQQAAGVEMASLKSLAGIGDAGIVFDTVIIDEAARANPLDLFIPMSMAGTRVILVGDHRQLPHLLEPEVEDEVAQQHDLDSAERQGFADSLFERLWRQLKQRSEKDSFNRVVMLDTQFRMHPLLGQLVSEQFYEKEGLPALKPGRAEDAFLADIPGYKGKVCGWIDVPVSRGPQDRSNGSRLRAPEALAVASEVKRLLEHGGPHLSIGVITFYSAQRDLIFEELMQLNITERDADSGRWQARAPWDGLTASGDERLRIGTVDAFQGKEFDVVLLSVVNTSALALPGPGDAVARAKAANAKYGHLRLSNRMNVAMSRQRSLLVAVGDCALAGGVEADEMVPALAAFLALCKGGRGIVR